MGRRKKKITIAYLPTIADWRPHDDDEIVEQTKHVAKEGRKKTGESHACEQTREEVWLNRTLSFFYFNLISRLLERRRLLLGGRGRAPSVHMPRCGSTNDAYLRCLPTV